MQLTDHYQSAGKGWVYHLSWLAIALLFTKVTFFSLSNAMFLSTEIGSLWKMGTNGVCLVGQ